MLTEKSFLRNVPICIEPKERITLCCVAFSADSIYLNYSKIIQILSQYNQQNIFKISYEERLSLFTYIWSIVDHTHNIRLLLKPKVLKGGITDKFISDFECATELRNNMDHLATNLLNTSKNKKCIPPLYGSLSYSIPRISYTSDNEANLHGYHRIVIPGGQMTHGQHSMHLLHNREVKFIEIPIGDFSLSAFDQIFYISDMKRDLDKIINKFETATKEKIERDIILHAEKNGLDAHQLLTESQNGAIIMVADIECI